MTTAPARPAPRADPADPARPVGGPLASRPGRWGLALALLAVHVALTLGLSSGLARDELESMLFAQGWAWGYDPEQPPLYNWLFMAVVEAVGPTLAGSILLRWSLIALGLLALYDALRRMAGGDGALAAGAVAAVAGTGLFGYEAARHFTHSTLLLTSTALLLWTVVRVVERPTAGRYVAVGAALAAALLSKYTMVVLAPALLLGALADPVVRARVFDRRVLLLVVVPLLALPGHVLWRLGVETSLAARVASITDAGASGWAGAVVGLARNVVADPVAAMAPGLVLMAVLLPWWRTWPQPAPRPLFERSPRARSGPRWDRVLAVYVAASMVLTFAVVLAGGGERLRYHYLMPAAVVLPACVLLWARAHGLAVRPWRARALGWGLAGLATLLTLGVAVDRIWLEPARCERCLPLLPAAAAAAKVEAAGFRGGTIVATDLDWGANLRRFFPQARLLALRYPDWRPPQPPGDGACLVVLPRAAVADGTSGPAQRLALPPGLEALLGAAPPADGRAHAAVHRLALSRAPERTVAFGFVLLPAGLGTCR